LPGIHTLPLDRVLTGSKITVLEGRHESGLAFMADGYARSRGTGRRPRDARPGLGNVVTSCMEAYGDDVPLVVLFVDAERKNVEKGVLHGVKAPEELFGNITKATFSISGGADLPAILDAAFRAAVSPRKGPVLVSIPYRCLEREAASLSSAGEPEGEPPFDPGPLERVLQRSQRPVIIGGGGLKDYGVEASLDGLCRESSVPFLTSLGGKGVLDEDAGYVVGSVVS
jgi:acetolactate synthase-1/2/3 large subunit